MTDTSKSLNFVDLDALDWKPGLVAMVEGRIVFRPNGGDVVHCIGIGLSMTTPPPVDDSEPAS